MTLRSQRASRVALDHDHHDDEHDDHDHDSHYTSLRWCPEHLFTLSARRGVGGTSLCDDDHDDDHPDPSS